MYCWRYRACNSQYFSYGTLLSSNEILIAIGTVLFTVSFIVPMAAVLGDSRIKILFRIGFCAFFIAVIIAILMTINGYPLDGMYPVASGKTLFVVLIFMAFIFIIAGALVGDRKDMKQEDTDVMESVNTQYDEKKGKYGKIILPAVFIIITCALIVVSFVPQAVYDHLDSQSFSCITNGLNEQVVSVEGSGAYRYDELAQSSFHSGRKSENRIMSLAFGGALVEPEEWKEAKAYGENGDLLFTLSWLPSSSYDIKVEFADEHCSPQWYCTI